MAQGFSVDIAGLRKDYGARTVLQLEALVLEPGRSYALIGPNGSGKSTLLRLLAGVIEADGGTVRVTGDRAGHALKVGFMPQRTFMFGVSALDNVALALKSESVPRDEARRRAQEALDAVGLSQLAGARGPRLSGGEAQRVALARMIVRDLDVLLLDEPTASMDLGGTALTEEALGAYRARTGCLLVTATHAPAQARRIADTAIMLDDGRMVEIGPVDDVLVSPRSEAGRAFLSNWTV